MRSESNAPERQEIHTSACPGSLADPGVESNPLYDWQLAHDTLVAAVLRLRAENRDLRGRSAATTSMLTEMIRHPLGSASTNFRPRSLPLTPANWGLVSTVEYWPPPNRFGLPISRSRHRSTNFLKHAGFSEHAPEWRHGPGSSWGSSSWMA